VGEIADRWIETVEEAGPTGEAVDPKQLLQTLMIGAEACMCPTASRPVCRL
jgi:hypothetical protein